ncbi:MAG: hypothetical protein GF383_15875 [Candidatus Lokiarchaeota archaeon]|nr:hypothetical protein [Candidatus Lokiarchaeota archaeon]
MVVNNLEAFVIEKNGYFEYVLMGEVVIEEFGTFYAVPLVMKEKVKEEEETPEIWPRFINRFMEKANGVKEEKEVRTVTKRKFHF